MKTMRQIYLETEEKKKKEEFKEIINEEYLDPEKLWNIYDENFYKWRNKNELPRLLDHFREKLEGFDEWQRTWFLDDKTLMLYGISTCVASKQVGKNPYKYIMERKWEDEITTFISDENIEGQTRRIGPSYETFRKKSSFISYLDWCKIRNIVPQKGKHKGFELLSYYSISNPEYLSVEVSILDGLSLLKMGGLKVPINSSGVLKVKYIEFANLSNSVFIGKMATEGKQLIISYSFLDNVVFENVELALVTIVNSTAKNITIRNSKIQQWNIVDSNISGEAIDSSFSHINITRGGWFVTYKDCNLDEFKANWKNGSPINFRLTYKALKKAFANQGDDEEANRYFILEKEMVRNGYLLDFLTGDKLSRYYVKNKKAAFYKLMNRINALVKYFLMTLNFVYWGYGRKPLNVIVSSMIIILSFALYFYVSTQGISFADSFFTSGATFTTLGYFNYSPEGVQKGAIIVEAFIGAMSIGALIGSISNLKF